MKINLKDFNKAYFATDWHWHHDRTFIWQTRGFKSIQEHDASIEQFIATLTPDDLLVYHGDIALNCTMEELQGLLDRIPCRTHFILGNHDQRVERLLQENSYRSDPFGSRIGDKYFFNGIFECCYVRKGGSKQLVSHSHFPLTEWNKMNKGSFSLSGHVHGNLKDWWPNITQDRKLDLSYDVHKRWALTFEEVDAMLSKIEVKRFHHGKPDS